MIIDLRVDPITGIATQEEAERQSRLPSKEKREQFQTVRVKIPEWCNMYYRYPDEGPTNAR